MIATIPPESSPLNNFRGALLNDLLNTSEKAIRWKVAEALWEINPGNQQAIDAFSNLLEARHVSRAGGGFELTKIPDVGALQVVSVLEKLKKLSKDKGISIAISDAQDIYRYRQVERDYDPPMKKGTSLSNVGIDYLIGVVQTSNDEIEIIRAIEDFTRYDFNSNLDRIVLALLELAQKDRDEQIRSKIAEALGQLKEPLKNLLKSIQIQD